MPQVLTEELKGLPLRVHTFLERLSELINRTAHAAALTALIETPTAHRYYLAVYVGDVSPFTPFYMAMINPCRRRIVYPSFLRGVRARWNQAFGNG